MPMAQVFQNKNALMKDLSVIQEDLYSINKSEVKRAMKSTEYTRSTIAGDRGTKAAYVP